MIQQQTNNAAIYLRLSRDDGNDTESNSIGNQRAILQRYARERGLSLFGEYVDDGISGTTFERDGFKRMIADIEAGKISAVLCKDMSRLGRNNALVAYYTEIFFPDNDVQFIAVNDGIDTAKGDNEIMGFRSVINEFYARDISKKIRSSYRSQALKGAFTGCVPPYGYMKDPEDKYRLIPNPETAGTLRRIFQLAASGTGTCQIGRILTEEGILRPGAYAEQRLGIVRPSTYKSDIEWGTTSVREIIQNRVYLGHMIANKQSTKSFKSKKLEKLPEEEHIVVLNTHEPLVDEELFEQAQRTIGTKKRGNKYGFSNIFLGIIKCADCGSGLAIVHPCDPGRKQFGYNCNRYRSKHCTNHYIHLATVTRIVLEGIQEKVEFVKAHEDELLLYAKKLAGQGREKELRQQRGELERSRKRCKELDHLIQKLFEQNAVGLLTDERFATLSSTYEEEQKALKAKVAELEHKLTSEEADVANAMKFFQLVRKYTEVTELTVPILRDLIDTVVVHAPKGVKKSRTQRVVVNFRFIKDNWFRDDDSSSE